MLRSEEIKQEIAILEKKKGYLEPKIPRISTGKKVAGSGMIIVLIIASILIFNRGIFNQKPVDEITPQVEEQMTEEVKVTPTPTKRQKPENPQQRLMYLIEDKDPEIMGKFADFLRKNVNEKYIFETRFVIIEPEEFKFEIYQKKAEYEQEFSVYLKELKNGDLTHIDEFILYFKWLVKEFEEESKHFEELIMKTANKEKREKYEKAWKQHKLTALAYSKEVEELEAIKERYSDLAPEEIKNKEYMKKELEILERVLKALYSTTDAETLKVHKGFPVIAYGHYEPGFLEEDYEVIEMEKTDRLSFITTRIDEKTMRLFVIWGEKVQMTIDQPY